MTSTLRVAPLALALVCVFCKKQPPAFTPPTCPTCVTADARGFTPDHVTLAKGGAGTKGKITFTRTSDETCAKEVVFPDLGIKQALPLNTSVAVEVPTAEDHTYAFQCGMGMYKSTVVVR